MKILKRSADFTPELKEKGAGALAKLQIPKKTKLFVDQTMRERENSIGKLRKVKMYWKCKSKSISVYYCVALHGVRKWLRSQKWNDIKLMTSDMNLMTRDDDDDLAFKSYFKVNTLMVLFY